MLSFYRATICTLCGIMLIIFSLTNWDFFWNDPKAKWMISKCGSKKITRFIYLICGVLVVILGISNY